MLKRIDAVRQLQNIQNKLTGEDQILAQVKAILQAEAEKRERIQDTLQKDDGTDSNDFDIDQLEHQRVFHLEAIKEMCIDYRLRFLSTKYFKNPIPQSGISEIKRLEDAHEIELKGFKIMAPSKLFKLQNADDPLLFAPIGNGYYYLIHKWGNDLHPLRKLMMMPFKNVVNMLITMFLLSMAFTIGVVDAKYGAKLTGGEIMITFLFIFKSVVAIILYYGFALGKYFSNMVWDSKYYNA